ncbi:MAG: hypothetical protein ACRDZ2_12345, partial [Ilumatobacteraceae bacterium]
HRLTLDDDCVELSSGDGSDDEACAAGDLELLEPLEHQGVVLRTDDVAGGERVQLIASVADLGAELIEKLPREAMFVAAGAEFADNATAVAVGDEVQIDFEDAYDVYELPVTAGITYIATFQDDGEDGDLFLDSYVQDEDGTWKQRSSVFEAAADGVARLVVRSSGNCDAPCLPDGGGTGMLRVQSPTVQKVDFPADLTGELGASGGILFTFEVTEQTSLLLTLVGDVSTELRRDDGTYVGSAGSALDLAPGGYELLLVNNGDSRQSFEVSPSEVAQGFGAALSLSEGGEEGTFEVEAGTMVNVAAEGTEGQDIVLLVRLPDGQSRYADNRFDDFETCRDLATVPCTASVTVSARVSGMTYGTASITVELT